MAFDRPRIRETEELRPEPVDDLDRQGPQEAADEDFGPVEDDWPQEPRTPEAGAAAQRHAAEAVAEYQRQQAELASQQAERLRRSADLDRAAGRPEQGEQSSEDRRHRETQQALRAGLAPTESRAPEPQDAVRSPEQPSTREPEATRDSPAVETRVETPSRGTAEPAPEARRSEGQQLDAQAHSIGRQPEGRNEAATLRTPSPQATPTTPSGPQPRQTSGPAVPGSGPAQRASGPAQQGSGPAQRPAAVGGNFQPTAEQVRRTEARAAQWIQQAQQTEARLTSAQTTDPRIADAQQALRVGLPPQRPPGAPQAPAQPAQPAPGQSAARAAGRFRPGNNRGSSGHRHEL
ncbi:MAG TPA: hypothetical protein VG497_04920 [Kribbella sp.]|nr:hypothetical protein [Kribbella sp.]